jgi:hypothetical protein
LCGCLLVVVCFVVVFLVWLFFGVCCLVGCDFWFVLVCCLVFVGGFCLWFCVVVCVVGVGVGVGCMVCVCVLCGLVLVWCVFGVFLCFVVGLCVVFVSCFVFVLVLFVWVF